MDYGSSLKKNTKNRKIFILALIVIALGLITFLSYRWWHQKKLLDIQQQSSNSQTELGNESKNDTSASNTNEQNQNFEKSPSPTPSSGKSNVSNALPVPILTKSSGNNGAVPAGANIEFVCTSTGSYSCSIKISGPKTIGLDKKPLSDNGRGEFGASWIWTAEQGSWTITSNLSDFQGSQKSSATQTLEVK